MLEEGDLGDLEAERALRPGFAQPLEASLVERNGIVGRGVDRQHDLRAAPRVAEQRREADRAVAALLLAGEADPIFPSTYA